MTPVKAWSVHDGSFFAAAVKQNTPRAPNERAWCGSCSPPSITDVLRAHPCPPLPEWSTRNSNPTTTGSTLPKVADVATQTKRLDKHAVFELDRLQIDAEERAANGSVLAPPAPLSHMKGNLSVLRTDNSGVVIMNCAWHNGRIHCGNGFST